MPAADFVLQTRRSLKSFTMLYVGLALLAILIWWAGYTFETGLSPVVIAVAGLVPLVLGIGYTWLVKRGTEYRVY
jgi:Flp pilus assembly protein TadB